MGRLAAVLALGVVGVGGYVHPGHRRRNVARRVPLRASPAPADLSPDEAAAFAVAREAATLLRDGSRDDDLVAASARVLELVSPSNNANALTPRSFARSVDDHRQHYGPLLTFDAIAASSAAVSRDGMRATVRTGLSGAAGYLIATAVWSLSLDDDRGWLVDAVLVQPEDAPPAPAPPKLAEDPQPSAVPGDGASFGALTSPRWVAKTVLNALRHVDDPTKNHGCGVALKFVSRANPSHALTPELFRTYLFDDDYPYRVLTRWLSMDPEDVDFDDDDRKASHDVLLTDVDDSEWTVTLELSRSDRSGAWLIDKLWCEEAY